MKKKIAAIALAVCILVVGIIGATMAYFTDTETKTNTFTFGKVAITLEEYSEASTGVLAGTRGETGIEYSKGLPGQVYSKIPMVTVDGDSLSAYITITATVPAAYDHADLLHLISSDAYTMEKKNVGDETVYYFYYNAAYGSGAVPAPFDQVKVNPALTGDVAGKTFSVVVAAYAVQADGFSGAKTAYLTAFGTGADTTVSATDISKALANADAGKTYALSEDVTPADTLTVGAAAKIDGFGYTITGDASGDAKPVLVLKKGGTVENLKITTTPAGIVTPTAGKFGIQVTGGDTVIDGCDVTFARAIFANDMSGKDLTIRNSALNGTYPINTSGALKKLTVTNTTLNGWTSFEATEGAVFTNCEFGKGVTGYARFLPYCNTTLTNCTFSAEFLDITAAGGVNGIDAGNQTTGKTIAFNDCYVMVGTVKTPLTASLLKQMFNADGAIDYTENTWTVDGIAVSFN